MGKPSWYYKRQAEEAEKREDYYRTRPAPVEGTTVTQESTTTFYYRTLNYKRGNDSVVFPIEVTDASWQAVGDIGAAALAAGLLTAPPDEDVAGSELFLPRPKGFFPSRAQWYSGLATPVKERTPYGTSWTRYYAKTGTGPTAKSHYSIPISMRAGEVTIAGVQNVFNAMFTQGVEGNANAARTPNTRLLGLKNGRAVLELESAPGTAIAT